MRDAIDHFLKQYDGSLTNIPAGILPDGPLANAYSFGWGNMRYDGLTRKGWLLLRALWPTRERALTGSDVAGPVWDDPDEIITTGQLHGVRRRINTFFATHHLPWRVRVREGKDCNSQGHELIVSLEHDESATADRVARGSPEERHGKTLCVQ